ncbi:peptidase M20 [Thalassobacillus devorans]|uniref:Peptidase M20 n=1 Tax=Thalassobacillus devorans TaxID=279813 RepID=A0ABQ1PFU3_9BACI|nr:amidohydrolase [Thalassobacillus devorans]NIK29406.1 aminobenzoyl-glutamate utilization protein A [Thalassobacillus devorans]GGC96414.1 peptidase M20 [Thalassobacillus devorans]
MSDNFTREITPLLMEWRRTLHQKPELGFMEYYTTYRIGKELEKLGFTIHVGVDALESASRMGVPDDLLLTEQENKALGWGVEETWMEKMRGGNTGVVATWDTEKKGEHLGLRFDIDALPIKESDTNDHFPSKQGFRSQEEGVMHACGHDGHTAIGLGVAHFIAQYKDTLTGRYTLIFQPAEEGGRGAKAITDKGWLNDIDQFYTGHIGINPYPVGTIAATTRGFLASTKLNVHFKGVASHAGMKPEEGKNALLAAATAATQLYAIPRHSGGPTRINVGKMTAGSGRNIIPETSYMEIETRGETKEINRYVLQEAKRILHASAAMHDVEVTMEFVGETEEIECDDSLVPFITQACEISTYVTEVLPYAKVSGSEDASFMTNKVQKNGGRATYMLFGTELPYGHHHPSFDYQEAVISIAVDAYIHILKGGMSHE